MTFFGRRNGRNFTELTTDELLESVGRYVRHIEVSPTRDTCKCIVERVPKPEGAPESMPQLIRPIEIALDCPVHTKEGFLLGYFEFMKRGHRVA